MSEHLIVWKAPQMAFFGQSIWLGISAKMTNLENRVQRTHIISWKVFRNPESSSRAHVDSLISYVTGGRLVTSCSIALHSRTWFYGLITFLDETIHSRDFGQEHGPNFKSVAEVVLMIEKREVLDYIWRSFISAVYRNSSPKNENLLKMCHSRCRWVCFFIGTDLEVWITCSSMDPLQWMGAVRVRVQTADKIITIIHK